MHSTNRINCDGIAIFEYNNSIEMYPVVSQTDNLKMSITKFKFQVGTYHFSNNRARKYPNTYPKSK